MTLGELIKELKEHEVILGSDCEVEVRSTYNEYMGIYQVYHTDVVTIDCG